MSDKSTSLQYLYNHKPSPLILRQHHVLRNLRKKKDTVITKKDKRNGVLILDENFKITLFKK